MKIIRKCFQKFGEERILPKLFSEITITLILKQDKDIIRETKVNICHEYVCKNAKQNFSKLNPTTFKKGSSPECKVFTFEY